MSTAVSAARDAARRIADEVGIACFLYEEAGCGRSLPEVRGRAFAGLTPDFGGPGPHPTAGAAAVGARSPLVAYNVDLDTGDLALARRIAASIRERDGGLAHVRALGLGLPSRGIVQVSTNLLRPAVTTIGAVFDAVADLAAAAGVGVSGSEIVGLIPRTALPESTARLLLREPPKILEAELARGLASPGGEAGTTTP
jgi:glutamate formiminotransferase